MLTLHEYIPSQNCWKVRVLLGLFGIPYRSQPAAIFSGESRMPEFLQLNPAGATPVLVLEDGRAIAGSMRSSAISPRARDSYPPIALRAPR